MIQEAIWVHQVTSKTMFVCAGVEFGFFDSNFTKNRLFMLFGMFGRSIHNNGCVSLEVGSPKIRIHI